MSFGEARRIVAGDAFLIAEYRTGHTETVARIVETPPEGVERDIRVTAHGGVAYRLGWISEPHIRQSRRIAWMERDGG